MTESMQDRQRNAIAKLLVAIDIFIEDIKGSHSILDVSSITNWATFKAVEKILEEYKKA